MSANRGLDVQMLALLCLAGLVLATPSPGQSRLSTSLADLPKMNPDARLVTDPGVVLPGDATTIGCPRNIESDAPLSLSAAIDVALCNSPQLQSAWAAVKIQMASLGEARSSYWPTLTGSASQLEDRTQAFGIGSASSLLQDTELYAALSWRVFDFGGRAAGVRESESLLNAALASRDADFQKAINDVVKTYFDAITADSVRKVSREAQAVAQVTLDLASRREARGAASGVDVLESRSALARATLDLGRAESAYQKALATLVYTLGIPSHTRLTLPTEYSEDDVQSAQDLSTWLTLTEQAHPAIVAARLQWEAAREHVTVVRSTGLPTLDFSANFFQNGRPGQGLTPAHTRETLVGLTLTMPIFDGYNISSQVAGAQAKAEQSESNLRDTEHAILLEVIKAYADVKSAADTLGACNDLLESAQSFLSAAQRRYERGAADIIEVINAQNALFSAEGEQVRCQSDWRSARLRLRASAGTIRRYAF